MTRGRQTLAAAGIAAPGREAALLLGSLLGLSEVQIRSRDDESAGPALAARFSGLLERRASGEPAAYLLGRREFYGRTFGVDERVLIPRPETELLVEIALGLDAALPDEALVLDIGTGSGCIALTLAAERPRWQVLATDLSPGALACAQENARRLALERRVRFLAADLAGPIALERLDLVVSTPPYVDPGELEAWLPKDPIARLEARLLADGELTPAGLETLRAQARAAMESAAAFALDSPYPDPSELTADVYA